MRPRGFTLVELLVVIAIFAALIGLSVPVLVTSRERARVAVCASNVRQLVLGLSAYEATNGTVPRGFEPDMERRSSKGYAGNASTINLVGQWWFDYSQDINHRTGDGLDVLTCPSKRQTDLRLIQDILCGNYGANLSVCRVERYMKPYKDGFGGKPLSFSQVRRPAETMLVVDSGYGLISWWHATAEPPVPLPSDAVAVGAIQHTAYVPGMSINQGKTLWPGQTDDAIGGRHPHKTVNVGFVSGHVAAKRADELVVEKTGDGQWNNSPLWQPGSDTVIVPVAATTP